MIKRVLNGMLLVIFVGFGVSALVGCNEQTRPTVADAARMATETAEWGIATAMVLPDIQRLGDEWSGIESAAAAPEGAYSQDELSQIDADLARVAMLVAHASASMGDGQQAMVWINRAAALGYIDTTLAAWESLEGIVSRHLGEMSEERRALVEGWLALGGRLAGNLDRMRDVPGGDEVTSYVRDAIALARTAAEIAAAVGAVKAVM